MTSSSSDLSESSHHRKSSGEHCGDEGRQPSARRRRISSFSEAEALGLGNCKKLKAPSSPMADNLGPCTSAHNQPRPPQRTSLDATSQSHNVGFFTSDPVSGRALLPASDPLLSVRSSYASAETDELEGVREVLRQRRLSRQSAIISPGESYSGIKVLKLAIQEHELPVRMAYKQLDELAANAERVKASIEKNRSLLLLQVKKHNSRYLRTALMGWRLYIDKKIEKQTMLHRAKMLLTQGLLSRAFKGWCLHLLRNRKYKRLQVSVEKILCRQFLRRVWKSWVEFVRKRLQKDKDRRKEKRLLKDMNDKIKERLGRRAEVFMHHKRLHRIFFAFLEGCYIVRTRHHHLNVLYQYMQKKRCRRMFKMWNHVIKQMLFHKRAVRKISNKLLRACFRAWRYKEFQLDICLRKMSRCRLSLIFSKWIDWMKEVEKKKCLKRKMRRNKLLRYFNGLGHGCQERRLKRCLQDRATMKILSCKLRIAFQAWLLYMQIQERKKFRKLQEYVAIIEKENERSNLECRRLSQIVESGEWGKQQLTDILQAKDVLAGEREALMSLIVRLQQQQTAAMEQKQKNDDEIKQFKDQLFGSNFMHQNKMMIKGASSFNTVVRALKIEAEKTGVNPDYLFASDRLAMDKISIFPDGEIRVKALSSFEKGKWTH